MKRRVGQIAGRHRRNRECPGQTDVPRGSADHNLKTARRHNPAARGGVPIGQVFPIQIERDVLFLTRRKGDFLESFELLRRLAGSGRKAQIELGHFSARERARVRQVEADLDLSRRTHRADRQITVAESGVGQAEPKREQRSHVVCVIPAIAHFQPFGVGRVKVVAGPLGGGARGHLARRGRNAYRQFA